MNHNKKNFEIHKVKDDFNNTVKQKHNLFNLPFKLLIVGKSMIAAKSSLIINLLLKEEGYKDVFKGENVYIINPSFNLDKKNKILQRNMDIPDENIFTEYDEDVLTELYDMLEEQAIEEKEDNGKVEPKLIIMDDVGFSGDLKNKQSGVISKLFCNSRHIAINLVITGQRYSQFSTTSRTQATGFFISSCSNKELELIEQEHNIIKKKDFIKIFREATNNPYTWFIINYENPSNERYLDTNFNIINQNINDKK